MRKKIVCSQHRRDAGATRNFCYAAICLNCYQNRNTLAVCSKRISLTKLNKIRPLRKPGKQEIKKIPFSCIPGRLNSTTPGCDIMTQGQWRMTNDETPHDEGMMNSEALKSGYFVAIELQQYWTVFDIRHETFIWQRYFSNVFAVFFAPKGQEWILTVISIASIWNSTRSSAVILAATGRK